jgi:iron complex outermembrane receptor protein
MNKSPNLRKNLLLFTACTVAAGLGGGVVALAQTAPATPAPVVVPGDGAVADLNAYQIQQVQIRYKKLILREKDIPNAISHITKQQIQAEGTLGSIQSVLRQTPSVNEYQSSPGQGVPVITIRGVRLTELTETLDGTPMTDILHGGQGAYLHNNLGSPVNLDQLEGITIFPGVAPPADQGFGSGGGTIAYHTLKPTAEKSAEVFGSYGSFNTSDAGFELNTGSINGQVDGARALLRYDQGYSSGFIDDTNGRTQSMLFSGEKPYDNGLSNVGLTVIYNRAFGYLNTAPLPVDLQNQNSRSYNFPKSLTFSNEDNTFLTAILHDETYINPHLIVGANLFEIHVGSTSLDYQEGSSIAYNPAFPYQITFQVPYFAYGPVGPTAVANGLSSIPNSSFTYDPFNFAPPGSDPTNPDSYTYGESAEKIESHSNTVGFQPKANIFFPHNAITVGALIAKESSGGTSWMYGNQYVPENIANAYSYGGGSQRSVYQVYGQDKIDLMNDKLHFQPGVTVASAYTSVISQFTLDNAPYKLQNWNVVAEPYIGVSYDLPKHVTAYASYAKGADFADTTNYSPQTDANGNVTGTSAPSPEIIHLYEAGLRYDTNQLYINADFYYQKITDADSFYTNYQTGQSTNGNTGAEQFRGYELDTQYNATPSLSFFGNASFNQSNYLNSYFALDTPFEDQFGYVFKGDPLASVPNWLGNFGFSYNKDNFGARLTEEYTGQQFITYDIPANVSPFPPNVTGAPGCEDNSCLALATTPGYPNTIKALLSNGAVPYIKQPGFLVSNLLLTYDLPVHGRTLKKLHFELNLQNILDVHYYSHLFNSPAEIPQGGGFAVTPPYFSSFYGPPRSITFEMSAKF